MILTFNFDLLAVAIVIALNLLFGFAVLFSDRKSATARLFFALTVVMSAWSAMNYLAYQPLSFPVALWVARLVLFFAVPMSLAFVLFIYTFPSTAWTLNRVKTWALLLLGGLTMVVTLTPLVFSELHIVPGIVTPQPTIGPGMLLFALVAVGSIPVGIYFLARKYLHAKGDMHRQLSYMLAGVAIMFTFIVLFDFIAPTVFENTSLIPLSALFVFPFIALTAYAIYRYHLFNLRVAATALLAVFVTIFSFVNIIYATTVSEVAINITAFLIVLLGSIRIVRDTFALHKLTEELTETNERQSVLLHFIGHEVKGFLTKDEGAFAALVDGDFGTLEDGMKPFVEQALAQARAGVRSVTDILTASNQKKGTMTYAKESFDLKALAAEIVEKERSTAEAKGLTLTFSADDAGAPYTVNGDKAKIGDNVLRNVIENSIHYTPSGSISVSLKKENGKAVFSVQDTGVGISDEDKQKLFTEGGHGKDSQRVNAHSTGYGLYIAKNIVDAHGGTIRAESEGEGKGATFTVELPV